jgi:hypothetical protein
VVQAVRFMTRINLENPIITRFNKMRQKRCLQYLEE